MSPHYEGAVLLACRSSTSLTLWSELPPQPAKEGVLSVSITIGSMEMSLSASKNNFIYSTNRSIPIVTGSAKTCQDAGILITKYSA